MKYSKFIVVLLISILLIPNLVLAQDEGIWIIREILQGLFGPDIPDWVMTYRGFVQYVVFPFIALFAVMYGILSEIRIFRTSGGHKAQIIIALMTAFLGGWWALSTLRYWLIVNAWLGTFFFGLLFFIGIIMWFYGRIGEHYYTITGRQMTEGLRIRNRLAQLRAEREHLENLPHATPQQQQRLTEVGDEINRLEGEYTRFERGEQ
jgi:hypothetical protein